MGNWKQWKQKIEMEMRARNSQNLMQINARVKPMINDHLLKTTSVQRPQNNYVTKMTDDLIQRPPLNKDFIYCFYILTYEV